jgi:arylsulfatase A-like enzyme
MRSLFILLTLSMAPLNAAHTSKPQPNILILLADDLKHHDLGFTGCKDIPTPHIDALCANSTHFTQAYSTAPLCAPSRAGLLTGRNQARFGFDFNPEPYVAEDQGNRLQHADRFKNGLPQSEKTLAHHLRNSGYQTAWIGKWHLGEAEWAQPKNHGFQHCYGFLPGVQSYFPMRPLEAKNAGDTPPLNHCLLDNGKWIKNTSNITAMLGTEAARYIAEAKENPWFLYLAFNAPHGPHQPDSERESQFAHITDDARRKLACTLSRLDDAVGEVIKSLDDSGQRERTLVFFINDHGVSSLREWSGGKGTMLEGGLRSLLFASWPGKLAEKAKRHDCVSFLDIAPTALRAAGVPITPEMRLEGIDLFAEMSIPSRPLAWRMDEAFAYRDEGDWKLVGNDTKTTLYDLKADPLEKADLSVKQPDKHAELLSRWKAWDAENVRPMWKSVSDGAKKPTGAENRKRREQNEDKIPEAKAGPFKDAAAIWHLKDSIGLQPNGEIVHGIELSGNEKVDSIARGGDGFAARLDGGHFVIQRDLGDIFDHGS